MNPFHQQVGSDQYLFAGVFQYGSVIADSVAGFRIFQLDVLGEVLDEAEGKKHRYAVYFEVTKDKKRKKRLILHVQSAYVPDQVTKRQEKAGKVSFTVLLRKAYLGEKIRG